MDNLRIVIFLTTVLISLSAIADKLKLPYPMLLITAGIILGFIPGIPSVSLDPDIIFLVFLPPLLYDAASKTYWNDFKSAIRPISALAIILVFSTTTVIAVAAHYFIPGFSWPLAFVLGSIVSPPDAVATTAITKGLGLNKKVVTILEGESLINDASALIAYRYAVAAATTGVFVFWEAGLQFLWLAGGGVAIGLITGFLFVYLHKAIHNPLVEASLSLLTPYVAFMAAEQVHTSGILAVVCAGLLILRHSNEVFSSPTRMRIRVIWDTLIFLLNGVIFILIGLQLPEIISQLGNYSVADLVKYSLMISVITILIRILWVFGGAFSQKLLGGHTKEHDFYSRQDQSLWKNVLIISWTGTRGVVSLATALALPTIVDSGAPFPQRPLILFLAFVVIFVTLIVQGLSLPLLLRILKVHNIEDSGQEAKELALVMADNIIHFIDTDFPPDINSQLKSQIRRHYEAVIKKLTKEINDLKQSEKDLKNEPFLPLNELVAAQMEISKFQRSALIKYYKENKFSNEVLKKFENELDIEDLRLNALLQNAKIR